MLQEFSAGHGVGTSLVVKREQRAFYQGMLLGSGPRLKQGGYRAMWSSGLTTEVLAAGEIWSLTLTHSDCGSLSPHNLAGGE